ncbi:hypothetical protein HJC23_004001 [Cyclotella cryptica]|uniref:Uncharacterized protein n=1 Tax=Cyclotella cryptica TaxID=29204 RepID=A0ABD3QUD1_9STRA
MASLSIIQMAALSLTTTFAIAPSTSAFSPSPSAQLAFALHDTRFSSFLPGTLSLSAKKERILSTRKTGTISLIYTPNKRTSSSYQALTKLHSSSSSYDTSPSTTIDLDTLPDMPLSELLDALHECHIRYAPNATRQELEGLLRAHFNEEDEEEETKKHSIPRTRVNRRPSKKEMNHEEVKEVVDAIVLPEEDEEQQQQPRSEWSEDEVHARTSNGQSDPSDYSKRRRKREDVYDYVRNSRHGSVTDDEYHERSRATARRRNVHNRNDRSRRASRYDRPLYEAQSRQKQQQQYPRNRYQSYYNVESDTPIIDIGTFDLPEDRTQSNRGQGVIYENGLQIFLMGFVEAGKTAAELTLDAARGVMDPWTSSSRGDGEWWFDEERGRDVYDVKVVEHTRERYGEDEYNGDGRSTRRRRRPRNRSRIMMDRDRGYETAHYWKEDEPEFDYQRESATSAAERLEGPLVPIESESTPTRKRPSLQSRKHTDKKGNPKPVYGLYNEDDLKVKSPEEELESRHSHHHKQEWKDRLRRKFDAALGLESSPSTTKQEAYYDSWIKHMERIDDSRKTRLRDKMNDERDSTAEPLQSESNPSNVPRNRRARMRAAKNSNLHKRKTRPSYDRVKRSKLRLDEKPFWKERGSIASMLFDNRPASWRKTAQKKRRNTLEVRFSK